MVPFIIICLCTLVMMIITQLLSGHIVYLWHTVVTFAPSLRLGANVTTGMWATNKQYALQKSCYCLIICRCDIRIQRYHKLSVYEQPMKIEWKMHK